MNKNNIVFRYDILFLSLWEKKIPQSLHVNALNSAQGITSITKVPQIMAVG